MATLQGVKISLPEMQTFRGKVDQDNEEIKVQLGKVSASMDYLKGTDIWKSEGGDAIQSKFQQLSPKFEKFYSTVKEYIKFLDDTIKDYDTTETAVVSNAQNVSDWK